ncbi:MAG: TM2 domain-containing protein [Dehalococcoidia bacterium]|jgi:TM2 domain-containing membrane protein YozV|nr:TM2 domain-containing protein [Dehalococcoidia bacterium]
MAEIIKYLPELEGEELVGISGMVGQLNDEQAMLFAQAYRSKRKSPTNVLLFNLLGFIALAGVHRFYLGQIPMGLIYLFTGGFCGIGTLIDIFTSKGMARKYNLTKASETQILVKGMVNKS